MQTGDQKVRGWKEREREIGRQRDIEIYIETKIESERARKYSTSRDLPPCQRASWTERPSCGGSRERDSSPENTDRGSTTD